MKTNIRVVLLLVAALAVAAAMFRQEKEMDRLRVKMAELSSLPMEGVPNSPAANPMAADFEELRRAVAAIHALKAEVTQLRREKVETSALEARIDKLASNVSAMIENFDRRADVIGGPHYSTPNTSTSLLHAISLAQSSPEEAARWVAALPPGREQNQAAMAVLEHWMGTDAASAAAWTTQFEEGPLRNQAMHGVARQWALRDWKAAAGWLETLPMGSSRDAAIGAFVTSADGHDIRLALDWANQLEAVESRAVRVEQTARRWLRDDNAAARAWIEKAQLPPGLAERLLSAK